MVAGTLTFLLGILLFQQLPDLPGPLWLLVLMPLALLSLWSPLRQRHGWLMATAITGFLWAWVHAAYLLRHELPAELEGVELEVEGVVAAIPESDPQRVRFLLECERMRRGKEPLDCPGRLRLTWYRAEVELEAGQRWRLQVRLKRPHGMVNPGGFDYEGWLFQQGIRATGYVREEGQTRLLEQDSGRFPLQRLRQRLLLHIHGATGMHPLAGLVAALAMGERQGISAAQWQVLRATGTNHLVAISGLHIGIIAGLAFFLGRRLWSLSARATRYLPAPKAGALAALLAAAAYAAMAGFSIPTQRALIMVTVVMMALFSQRALRPARVLALAMGLVLSIDPSAVLAPGFWLSFAAVAVIIYGMGGRLGTGGLWWRWGRVQLVVALGLAPLLAIWFQQVPLIGPLANLLAVPWVSLVVVPLVLLAVVLLPWLPAVAEAVMHLVLWSLEGLWWWLQWSADLLPAHWGVLAPSTWGMALAGIGLIWLLAPHGWPARWVGGLWLLPLVLHRPAAPAGGEAWLTQLDVGQGLAVVVRTAGHALLFDAGPRYGEELDAGEAVIVPYLRQQGIDKLDVLLLSHGDIDHVGGSEAVMAALPVGHTLASGRGLPLEHFEQCRRGMSWQWDGVRFEILHPAANGNAGASDNNGSCVLRIITAGGRALLTGDIEVEAETELVTRIPEQLRSEVVVVPHHGSRTSSSANFVAAVAPDYVLYSSGYRNRYHFPHPAVVTRYREAGAQALNSATDGAITLRLGGERIEVVTARQELRRYWYSD